MLATGLGILPAVWVQIRKKGWFGSRPVKNQASPPPGSQYPDSYPSTRGFSRVWFDPSGPISGSSFLVVPFIVAFRYPAVNRKIIIMVCYCSSWTNWPPVNLENGETGSLPRPRNERQQSVNNVWYSIVGNLSGDWFQTFINEVSASSKCQRGSDTLPAPS